MGEVRKLSFAQVVKSNGKRDNMKELIFVFIFVVVCVVIHLATVL